MIRHAGLIALRRQGLWRGVLIEGVSGSGKSDVALRALAFGFRLVADDRVLLWTSQGALFGRAPDTLAGLIEVRGVGIVPADALRFCEVVLAVRAGPGARVPEPTVTEVMGLPLPLLELDLREPSAPLKLSRAMDTFDLTAKRRI